MSCNLLWCWFILVYLSISWGSYQQMRHIKVCVMILEAQHPSMRSTLTEETNGWGVFPAFPNSRAYPVGVKFGWSKISCVPGSATLKMKTRPPNWACPVCRVWWLGLVCISGCLPACNNRKDPKGTAPVHPRRVCIDEPIPSNYWIQYDRMKNHEKRLPGRFRWAPQHWALAVSVDAVPLRIMTSVPMPLCKITHVYPSSVPNSLTYGYIYIWGIILWCRWFSITSTMAVLGQPHPRSSEIDCNFFEAWLKVANQFDRPIQQKILRLWYE